MHFAMIIFAWCFKHVANSVDKKAKNSSVKLYEKKCVLEIADSSKHEQKYAHYPTIIFNKFLLIKIFKNKNMTF